MSLYRRADLSRIGVILVALVLAMAATEVGARESCAADVRRTNDPAVQALRQISAPISGRSSLRPLITGTFDRPPFEAAMAEIDAGAMRSPELAAPVEHLRKVE